MTKIKCGSCGKEITGLSTNKKFLYGFVCYHKKCDEIMNQRVGHLGLMLLGRTNLNENIFPSGVLNKIEKIKVRKTIMGFMRYLNFAITLNKIKYNQHINYSELKKQVSVSERILIGFLTEAKKLDYISRTKIGKFTYYTLKIKGLWFINRIFNVTNGMLEVLK